jgi:branched-chain amino acid aminotransferase
VTVGSVWVDGRLVSSDAPAISAFDHGLLTGDGVFETLKTVGGRPFALTRHCARLEHSARGLGLGAPDRATVEAAIEAVVRANGIAHGRVRVTVTGGPSPLGSERGPSGPTVIVAVAPMPHWPATAAVCVVPWSRNERGALAGLKTTTYGENVVALAYAHERSAGEAIFGNLAGNLCEGTGTNVFLVLDGELITPPLSAGCLAGVTRALVLEVTDAVERDVPLARLGEASELFLTSSTRDVQAVSAVDGVALPVVAGPITRGAADAFAALVARDLDP